MLMGKVLAEAAMHEDKLVTWLPSYGAEVRGGTAHCMVVISDQQIGSPYIDKADSLIVMNQPSLLRFKARLKNKGVLIANSSLIDSGLEKTHLAFPFTELALKLDNIRVANMVALGCYIAAKKIIAKETVIGVMEKIAPSDKKNLIEVNKTAFLQGMKLLQERNKGQAHG